MNTTSPACEISETSRPSLETRLARLMSLQAACLASLRVLSDKCAELLTSVGSGPKSSDWWARFDPGSVSLRTRQASLFSKEGEPGTELCQDWSRAGMIVGGMYFPLPRLVQGISGNDSYSPLPTPTANPDNSSPEAREAREARGSKTSATTYHAIISMLPTPVGADGTRGPDLAKANRKGSGADDLVTHLAKMLPTPTGRDYKDTPGMSRTATDGRERDDQLPRRIYGDESTPKTGGMRLTPEFLCWLMGYPPDWLKPLRAVPATQLCRKSSNPSPEPSSNS